MITVNAKLGYSVVDYSKDNENYLLITLTGKPIQEEVKRPPISVVGLLDLSSSMSPDYKIGYLKKSVIKLIDNLKDTDRLSLIGYSTNAWKITDLVEMTAENKKKAIDIVNGLVTYNMTNISEALTLGFDAFREKVTSEGINRVILFTDGCPTSGNCNPAALINLAGNVPEGVQVTTMGYGKPAEGAFNGMGGELNTLLLEKMADNGKGNYYYMSDPDSCGRAFANELAGLLTVVGQKLKLMVKPKAHMSIIEVMDDVTVEDINGNAVISVPDIIADETKYILLKVKTTATDKPWARPASLVEINLLYNNVIDGVIDSVSTSAKITFAKKDFTKDMDADVKTQLAVVEAIKAQEKAFAMAQAGDYAGATYTLNASVDALNNSGTARGAAYSMGLANSVNFCSSADNFNISSNIRGASLKSMKSGRASGGVYDTVLSTTAQKGMQDNFVDNTNIPASTTVTTTTTTTTTSTPFIKTQKTNRW